MFYFIIAICVIFSVSGRADLAQDMGQKISVLIQRSGLKKNDLGMLVTDSKGRVLYHLNSEKKFIPASITKLLTTAAVMNGLQPDYRFHTQVFVDGHLSEKELIGNIYLKGGGDPAFVSEKMWMLVNEFTRSGIKKISGQIIVDDSFFDSERFDIGRETDRNDRAYDAPVGGLSFNWNSTTIYVRPGSSPGEKAHVFIDPENDYVKLENKVITSKVGTDLIATRIDQKDHNIIVVSGKIASDSSERHIYKNILDPALYAGHCFREFLKQRQIEVTGDVRAGPVPSLARLTVDFKGEPLSREITDMNKFSNNFVAEMLAKDLGAIKTSSQGKMKDGVEQVRHFLQTELGWQPADFNLVNVSGFTRKNLLSPDQFVSVLSWIEKQFRFYPEILQSLPIAGVDGTLEKRMKGTEAERWVRAKTGLLTGVVALAGYAGRSNGVLFFTFIYNGSGDEGHVRSTFDIVAASLLR